MLPPAIPAYVARVLSHFPEAVWSRDGWKAPCPCPTHGSDGHDENPSIRITIGDGGKILIICQVGCSLPNILAATSLSGRDLFPQDGDTPAEPLVAQAVDSPEETPQLYSLAYQEAVTFLDLDDEQMKPLLARGFSEEWIRQAKYVYLEKNEQPFLARRIHARFGTDAYLVPGIICGKDGPTLASNFTGWLIPVRALDSRILALKVRKPDSASGGKYCYFSTPSGPSSGAPCHHPINRPSCCSTLRITEGELKADAATHLSGIYTIGISGVGNWRSALPTVKELAPHRVLLTYDQPDARNREPIRRHLSAFYQALISCGVSEVCLEIWGQDGKPCPKGIDDALLANEPITILSGRDADRYLGLAPLPSATVSDIPPEPVLEPLPFPLEAFPPALRLYLSLVSENLQMPPDFTGVSCLVTAGRALGTCVEMACDPSGEWKEMPNLWAAIIAPPGSMKTAAMDFGMIPALNRQSVIAAAYQARADDFAGRYRVWREANKSDPKTAGTPPTPPAPPETIYTSDVTVECLVGLIQQNSLLWRYDSSVMIYRDEIAGFVKSMNLYRSGKGGDIDFYLASWSRAAFQYNRKTNQEVIHLRKPTISIFGSIQPDRLIELQGNRVGSKDGFIDRFLFSKPANFPAYRPSIDSDAPRPPDERAEPVLSALSLAKAEWIRVCSILFCGVQPLGRNQPQQLYFNPDGWRAWMEWLNTNADEIDAFAAAGDFDMRGVWNKMRGQAARILMILHFLRIASGELPGVSPVTIKEEPDSGAPVVHHTRDGITKFAPVDAESVRRTILLVNYFKNHWQITYNSLGFGPFDRKVNAFVAWACKLGRRVKTSDLYRGNRFGCKTRSDALALFRAACDRGRGEIRYPNSDSTRGATFEPSYDQEN